MKHFILSLLGVDLQHYTYTMEANAGLAAQLDTKNNTITQLRTQLTEQKENNAKLYAYNRELENINQKLSNDLDIANSNYKILTDQKAEIEQERLELQKQVEEWEMKASAELDYRNELENKMEALQHKYAEINHSIHTVRKQWEKEHLLPLRKTVSSLQGRLGAFIKKYGDLPHKRENQRNKIAESIRPKNETTQNPTAN